MKNQSYDLANAKLRVLRLISPLFALAFATACSGVDDGTPGPAHDVPAGELAPDAKENPTPTTTPAAKTPVPIASLTLESGNVVEFYDFGRGALLSETGAAGVTPALGPQEDGMRADQLVATWRRLAPALPVPQALTALQDRLMDLPEPTRLPNVGSRIPEQSGLPMEQSALDLPEGVLAIQDGCGNGCCDYAWLTTIHECQAANYPLEWINFKYAWSTLNTSDDAIIYQGLACSAHGTSEYNVSISGYGGSWPVFEATYRTFRWVAGHSFFWGWDEQPINSSVNSSANQHMHTYCGHVAWD
jgi:hypothetical protein